MLIPRSLDSRGRFSLHRHTIATNLSRLDKWREKNQALSKRSKEFFAIDYKTNPVCADIKKGVHFDLEERGILSRLVASFAEILGLQKEAGPKCNCNPETGEECSATSCRCMPGAKKLENV